MGLFNKVMVPCTECGQRTEFQSKSGYTKCTTHDLENCPMDVLAGVNRYSPYNCENCGELFCVRVMGFGAATKYSNSNRKDY